MLYIVGLSCLIVGIIFGYYYRDIKDRIKKLEKRTPEPKIGVTYGSYGKVNEVANQGGVGVFTPKTPEQLEWEEQERLREAQHNVKVK